MRYQRVTLKLSGEAVSGDDDFGFDPDALEHIADEVLGIYREKDIRVVWMQLGVRNDAAAGRLESAGLSVIMNRCPKIEYGRLFGELSWSGVNTGIISAKRRSLAAG